MIETLTLITLSMLYLFYFRPGKTPALKNPLIIERVGRYRMALAPQLNLAQPFVEAIAARLVASNDVKVANQPTHLFEVRDKRVTSHGFDRYLLAITGNGGMLHFYAVPPFTAQRGENSDGLQAYFQKEMADFPPPRGAETKLDERWIEVVTKVAAEQDISICSLEY